MREDKSAGFPFNRRFKRKHRFSEQCCEDNAFSRRIAGPLCDAGLRIAAIAEHSEYESFRMLQGKVYHTFQMLLQGRMEMLLGNQRKVIGPGELTWVPAGAPFDRKALGPIWWLYLEFHDTELWRPLKKHGPYSRDYEHVALLFANLRTILDVQNSGSEKAVPFTRECARFLVHLLSQEMSVAAGGAGAQVVAFQHMMDEIADEPQKDWRAEEMARRMGTSRTLFFSRFRNQFGISPVEAVIRQRMRKAMWRLTDTNDTVMDVALSVGYESVASFTRLFTQHAGMPPGRYRKEYGAAARIASHAKGGQAATKAL